MPTARDSTKSPRPSSGSKPTSLNTTWVSVPIQEDRPSDEELFGPFYDAALEAEPEGKAA